MNVKRYVCPDCGDTNTARAWDVHTARFFECDVEALTSIDHSRRDTAEFVCPTCDAMVAGACVKHASVPEVTVKFRKLRDSAVIPQYATDGAAGFDLVAVEDMIIAPGETALVPLGFAVELPPGYEMQIRPRSGISLKTKLRVANSPGTIDADYRGEVAVIIDNISKPHRRLFLRHPTHWNIGARREGTYAIRKGDRIAQGVIAPVFRANFVEVTELSVTARRDGGFGHTGTEVHA